MMKEAQVGLHKSRDCLTGTVESRGWVLYGIVGPPVSRWQGKCSCSHVGGGQPAAHRLCLVWFSTPALPDSSSLGLLFTHLVSSFLFTLPHPLLLCLQNTPGPAPSLGPQRLSPAHGSGTHTFPGFQARPLPSTQPEGSF